MRVLFFGFIAIGLSAPLASAQSWQMETLGGRDGVIYRMNGDQNGAIIQALTRANIEDACFCDLDERGGRDAKERVEFGLSTIPMDAYDLAVTKHNSTPHFHGEAETAEGTRMILAGLYDNAGQEELRVYVAEPDAFSLADAKNALTSLLTQTPTAIASAPVKAAPKPSSPSGSDLLAGVKRDLEKASSNRAKTPPKTTAPKSKSGYMSGSDLLAGIRKDVYGPAEKRAKERAVQQAAAQKAAREKALRDVIKSGGYDSPVLFENDQGRQYVANWVEDKPRVFTATPKDKRAPRLAYYAYKDKTTKWGSRKAFEGELKKAGLSAIKFEGPETLEVTQKLLNSESYIIAGSAKRAGKPVRLFANISHTPATGDTNVLIYEASLQQWKDWGGIATPMAWLSVHKQSDFTPGAIKELGVMKPADEIKVFEEHFTGRAMSLFQGIMMTNTQTLSSMRSFNMSSATCAGMENCTVNPDGTGGYEAVID